MNEQIPDRTAPPRRNADEMRVYGINACLALFAKRPHDLRKVYLLESRIPQFKAVLAWCVQKKLGYRVVGNTDLEKLTASQHHEGVCFEARKIPLPSLTALLQRLPRAPQPALLAWLDGVGNPHNIGAVLRSAANFGAAGVLLSADAAPGLSGAACRVAEGGAEAVPMARIAPGEDALGTLRNAGFTLAATVPQASPGMYLTTGPARERLLPNPNFHLLTDRYLVEITPADVEVGFALGGTDSRSRHPADTVVLIGHNHPNRELADALRGAGPAAFLVGDAAGGNSLRGALHEAAFLARTL